MNKINAYLQRRYIYLDLDMPGGMKILIFLYYRTVDYFAGHLLKFKFIEIVAC